MLNRRDFLRSAASAAAFTVMPVARAFGSKANSAISIGVIGAGWRGNHIAAIMKRLQGDQVRIAGLADPFRDQLESARERYPDDNPSLFEGLEGYRQLLRSGVDAVIISSPPFFHPEHFESAVEEEAHVYLEKPVSVDAFGARKVRETGARAPGGLSIMVGFQSRGRADLVEGIARVRAGAIGQPVAGRGHYNAGPMAPKETSGLTAVEQRLRNWVWDRVLSGDIIVEQNVHVLDIINWALGSPPERAYATASRSVRSHWGDTADNYHAIFWYPGDVHVSFSATQFLDLPWGDSAQSLYGADGAIEIGWGDGRHGAVAINGANPWSFNGTIRDPEEVRVEQFLESIRSGRVLNETASGVDSTLTAILARRSAEKGTAVTWDEVIEEDERLFFGV